MQWQNINSYENFTNWLFIFCHCIYYLFFTLCILYKPLLHSNRTGTAFIRKQLVQINRTHLTSGHNRLHPTSGHNRLYSFHFGPYLSHLKSIFISPQATFVSPHLRQYLSYPRPYLSHLRSYLSHLSPFSPQPNPHICLTSGATLRIFLSGNGMREHHNSHAACSAVMPS